MSPTKGEWGTACSSEGRADEAAGFIYQIVIDERVSLLVLKANSLSPDLPARRSDLISIGDCTAHSRRGPARFIVGLGLLPKRRVAYEIPENASITFDAKKDESEQSGYERKLIRESKRSSKFTQTLINSEKLPNKEKVE